jgi:CheY-like chemotaxis protein
MGQKQPRILLIDDNRHGMVARRELLESKGFDVQTAASGASGLRAFDESEFDVVVTDYRMPKMGGREVLQAIRVSRPQVPVVILSGCIEQLGLKDELSEIADAVLFKGPSELDDLLRTVSKLVKRGAGSASHSSEPKLKEASRRRKA